MLTGDPCVINSFLSAGGNQIISSFMCSPCVHAVLFPDTNECLGQYSVEIWRNPLKIPGAFLLGYAFLFMPILSYLKCCTANSRLLNLPEFQTPSPQLVGIFYSVFSLHAAWRPLWDVQSQGFFSSPVFLPEAIIPSFLLFKSKSHFVLGVDVCSLLCHNILLIKNFKAYLYKSSLVENFRYVWEPDVNLSN